MIGMHGAYLEQIDVGINGAEELRSLVHIHAHIAADIGGIDHQQVFFTHGASQRLDNLHRETHPVFQTAAVFIGAPVGDGIQKLADVEIVAEVKHAAVKAQIFIGLGMLNMCLNVFVHICTGHHPGTCHGTTGSAGHAFLHGLNAGRGSDLVLILLGNHGKGIRRCAIGRGNVGIVDLQGHAIVQIQFRSDVAAVIVDHLRHKRKAVLTSDVVQVIHGKMTAVGRHFPLIQISQILHQQNGSAVFCPGGIVGGNRIVGIQLICLEKMGLRHRVQQAGFQCFPPKGKGGG